MFPDPRSDAFGFIHVRTVASQLFFHCCFNSLLPQNPDPKKMQIMMTGFLDGKNAKLFMTSLWELLVSAQSNPTGIPKLFLDQKKDELKKKMVRKTLTNVFICIILHKLPPWGVVLMLMLFLN